MVTAHDWRDFSVWWDLLGLYRDKSRRIARPPEQPWRKEPTDVAIAGQGGRGPTERQLEVFASVRPNVPK
jgi:hypothetical protein